MTSLRKTRYAVAPVLLLWGCVVAFPASDAIAQTVSFEPVGKIPGPADLIRVQGTRAFVSAGKTLTVFDVSNPTSPTRVGAYSFPDRILGFRPSGSLVYVAADLYGLGILELSQDGTPKLRGALKTPGSAKNVAVSGRTALVADQVAGVDRIDVSDPAKPVLTGSVYLDGFASDVVTAAALAFAVDRPTGFYVLDLSKPESEEPLSTLQSSTAINGSLQVEVVLGSDGRPVVAVRALGAMLLFDITNPAKPVELPPFRTPGRPQRVSIRDSMVYVADGPGGLQVVDLSQPSRPRIAGAYKTQQPAGDIAVADSLAFVVERGGDIVILRQTGN
jgi:hypothetical protein